MISRPRRRCCHVDLLNAKDVLLPCTNTVTSASCTVTTCKFLVPSYCGLSSGQRATATPLSAVEPWSLGELVIGGRLPQILMASDPLWATLFAGVLGSAEQDLGPAGWAGRRPDHRGRRARRHGRLGAPRAAAADELE